MELINKERAYVELKHKEYQNGISESARAYCKSAEIVKKIKGFDPEKISSEIDSIANYAVEISSIHNLDDIYDKAMKIYDNISRIRDELAKVLPVNTEDGD